MPRGFCLMEQKLPVCETGCGRVFHGRTESTPGSAEKCFFLHAYRRISTFGAGISQTARDARVILLAIPIRYDWGEDCEEEGNNTNKEP